MTDDSNDLSSLDSNSRRLFPILNSGPASKGKHKAQDVPNSLIISNIDDNDGDSTSIHHMRTALFKSVDNRKESIDISANSRCNFKSQFDTDSLNTSIDEYSINTSIVKELDLSEGFNMNENQEPSKFKFLDSYTKLYQLKYGNSKMLHNNEDIEQITSDDCLEDQSIFGISKLDDFNKYIKKTEINEVIRKKYEIAHDNNEMNILNVIPTVGMGDYVGDFEDDHKKHQNKSPWYNLEWKRLFFHKRKNNGNEINEFSLQDSSNSNEPHEKEKNVLQRKLKIRHLQMISFGGTLGVGLFLNSGKALTIAGGLGTLLAFAIVGLIVLATIVSFCEMVTFVSVVDGVSGLSSRFVDDSFGFAMGWLYFVSFAIGLAGEIVASVIMLSYFPKLKIVENKGSTAGFVTLFLLTIMISNLVDVRVFGEVEYISSLIKLVTVLVMIILMIILNTGYWSSSKIGFKYWDYSKSDFEHNIIFGLFRPSFDLVDNGMNSVTEGIGGDKGRFLGLLTAILIVSYAYSGTEIVCIAACEAKNPRKALPSATRRVFWRILIFYCLSAFVVSLNVYAGDPRLLRYYSGVTGIPSTNFANNFAVNYVGGENCYDHSNIIFGGYGSGSQSPWIVALQSVKLCKLSSVINGFLVFFAVSCGNAQLYVSSRTLYSLALQSKAPKFLTYCNKQGIPYYSVLFAGSFGLLAFSCVNEKATNVFQNLTSLISSSGISVWFAMCLSYIRFYYGLKKRPDIISRDDKSFPYRSKFQPYTAFVGLIGSSIILLFMGFVVFLKGHWDTLFFFSSYGSLMIFAILFIGHKYIKGTTIPSLETLDFDSGRREIDRYIWDGGREYNIKNIKEVTHKWLSFLA